LARIPNQAKPETFGASICEEKLRDSGAQRCEVFERFLLQAKNTSAKYPFLWFFLLGKQKKRTERRNSKFKL